MLFGPVVVALYALVPVIARPTTVSLLTGTNERWSGKMALSRDDMGEMGRLAKLVNKAYCPSEHLEQESPALYLQPRSRSRQESTQQTTNILVTSRDSDIELTQNPGDMSWYIAHTPSTGTLTLAISSFNDMEALLDMLDPTVAPLPTLVPLPEYIFPLDQQPIGLLPQIYAAYLALLETHGAVALMTLLDIIDNPPKPNKGRAPLGSLLSSVARRSRAPPPISRVEIVGHGLGSAVGLLVSLGLHVNQPVNSTVPISVQSKLFSLPRVGDASFANWIDDLVRSDDSLYSMFRITSFGDAVPHLPEQHLGLEHPTSGEIWISSDPHVAYACQGQGSNDEACGMGVSLGKTNVRDGMGPYGGVWVGNQACRPVEHDGL